MNSFPMNSLPGLPKWPAMVVVGEPVTQMQAAEILVRTNRWTLSTNDRDFARAVYAAISVPLADADWHYPDHEDVERFRRSDDALDLEYLHNHRVASAYVGGPHGWCDWSGCVGCDEYNIGKWPSADGVLAEWQTIAAAFPFLKLRCQIFSGEQCEDGVVPLVEYVVEAGAAIAREPSGAIATPRSKFDPISIFTPGRERGCSIEALTLAVAVTRERITARSVVDPRGGER